MKSHRSDNDDGICSGTNSVAFGDKTTSLRGYGAQNVRKVVLRQVWQVLGPEISITTWYCTGVSNCGLLHSRFVLRYAAGFPVWNIYTAIKSLKVNAACYLRDIIYLSIVIC